MKRTIQRINRILLSIIICSAMFTTALPEQFVVYASQTTQTISGNDTTTVNGTSDNSSDSDLNEQESKSAEEETTSTEEMSTTTEEATTTEEETTEEMVEELDYILGRPMTDEEIAAQKALEPKNLPTIQEDPVEDYQAPYSFFSRDRSINESYYDSRDYGYITKVMNQNPWGTCWACSTIASAEANAVKKGLGSVANTDLSERHLAYFSRHTGEDILGNASQDTMTFQNDYYNYSSNFLLSGGSKQEASLALENWKGLADESEYPYQNDCYYNNELMETDFNNMMIENSGNNSQNTSYHLRNSYFVNGDDMEGIKTLIKDYGAVSASFYYAEGYYNYNTGAFFCNATTNSNHAITVVGWDDNYSKKNFVTGYQPENDGAWIVKNSWTSGWGDAGYFFISYEDTSFQGTPVGAFEVDANDVYDNNYFHSGNTSQYYDMYTRVAECFTANANGSSDELLKAVGISLYSAGTNYTVKIYTDLPTNGGIVTSPIGATELTSQSGSTMYSGFYTIDLGEPVTLRAGKKYSVVFEFDDTESVNIDSSVNYWSITFIDHKERGESFGSYYSNGAFGELTDATPRIHAFTDNLSSTGLTNAPTISMTSVGNGFTGVTNRLSWDKCSGADNYTIYRSINGIESLLTTIPATDLQYSDVVPFSEWGQSYQYSICAVYNGVESDKSVQTEAFDNIVLPEVKISNINTKGRSNTITWKYIAGATGYKIERKLVGESEYSVVADVTDSTAVSYTDTNIPIGTYYMYRVSVRRGDYITLPYEVMAYVGGKTALNNIQINWGESANYRMNVSRNLTTGSSQTSRYASSTKISYNSLNIGDTYSYYSNVYSDNYFSNHLYTTNTVTYTPLPPSVTISDITQNGKEVNLTWGASDGAVSYEICRGTSTDNMSYLGTTESLNYTDEVPAGKTTYYYKVLPTVINSAGEPVNGECTQAASIYVEYFPVAPTISTSNGTYSSVTISWSADNESTGYKLYRGTTSSNITTEILSTTDKTKASYTDTNLEAGTTYYYQLKVCSGSFLSEGSNIISYSPQLGTPLNLTASLSMDGEKTVLSWTTVEGADSYQIYRAKNNGNYVSIGTSLTGEYSDSDITDGNKYTYKVRAYSNATASHGVMLGEFSTAVMMYARPLPVTVTEVTQESETAVLIKWNAQADVDTYKIYRSNNNTDYSAITSNINTSTLEYTDTTIEAGKIYYYKIVAVKNGFESKWSLSTVHSVVTTPAAPVVAPTDDSITYNSIAIVAGSAYEYAIGIMPQLSETPEWRTVISDGTLTFNGLLPNTSYYVFVRMKNADGINISNELGGVLNVKTKQLPDFHFSLKEVNLISSKNADLDIVTTETNFKIEEVEFLAVDAEGNNLTIANAGTIDNPIITVSKAGNNLFTYNYENKKVYLEQGVQEGTIYMSAIWGGIPSKLTVYTPMPDDKFVTNPSQTVTDAITLVQIDENSNEQSIGSDGIFLPYSTVEDMKVIVKADAEEELGNLSWSISDRRIASVVPNNDGTATIIFKKAGCVKVQVNSKKIKKSAYTLIACVDTKPVLKTSSVVLNKATDENVIGKEFYFEEINQAAIQNVTITDITKGGESYTDKFSLTPLSDGGYRISASKEDIVDLSGRYLVQLSVTTGESPLLPDDTEKEHTMSFYLQIQSVSPRITVKTISVNRLDSRTAKNAVSLPITVRNIPYEDIENITIPDNSKLFGKVSIINRNGTWMLALTNPWDINAKYLSGKVDIKIKGYQAVSKSITIYLYENTPKIVPLTKPVIYLKNVETDSIMEDISLYDETNGELFTDYEIDYDIVSISDGLMLRKNDDGSICMRLDNLSNIKKDQTFSATINVSPCDEYGTSYWKTPAKVKVSMKVCPEQLPKLSIGSDKLTINKASALSTAQTVFTTTSTDGFVPIENWTINKWDSVTNQYVPQQNDDLIVWNYDEYSHMLSASFKDTNNKPDEGTYQYQIKGMVKGFTEEDTLTQNISVKVVNNEKQETAITNLISLIQRFVLKIQGKSVTKTVTSPEIKVLYRMGSSNMTYCSLGTCVSANDSISEISVLSMPDGLGVAVNESGIIVKIMDRSIKPGTYTVKARITTSDKKTVIANVRVRIQ